MEKVHIDMIAIGTVVTTRMSGWISNMNFAKRKTSMAAWIDVSSMSIRKNANRKCGPCTSNLNVAHAKPA